VVLNAGLSPNPTLSKDQPNFRQTIREFPKNTLNKIAPSGIYSRVKRIAAGAALSGPSLPQNLFSIFFS
jgi:hypothetical protein